MTTCSLSYYLSKTMMKNSISEQYHSVYIIGGLYGNVAALEHILFLQQKEHYKPTLIFNGDFNWFNRNIDDFNKINQIVLKNIALRGNVETELAEKNSQGCGCNYPNWVSLKTINYANEIMKELRYISQNETQILLQLAKLPTFYKIRVNNVDIMVLHGDPDNLAGWGLAYEMMPEKGVMTKQLINWFNELNVDMIACTHTCLPFMQNWDYNSKYYMVVNNGSAGMANFNRVQCPNLCGVMTRIATYPSPHPTLYGTIYQGVHIDAIPIQYDLSWINHFEQQWDKKSAAYNAYHQRITQGTNHTLENANRLLT